MLAERMEQTEFICNVLVLPISYDIFLIICAEWFSCRIYSLSRMVTLNHIVPDNEIRYTPLNTKGTPVPHISDVKDTV